ncbi:MAG: MBL fold metallo-hydrolase [Solirubrobacterales bacterium]
MSGTKRAGGPDRRGSGQAGAGDQLGTKRAGGPDRRGSGQAGAPGPASVGAVTYVGHSTVLLELAGARLLTDPMLRDRVGLLRRHPPPVAPATRSGLDAVLISHLHRDHLDSRSMRQIEAGTAVVVPRGGGSLVSRFGRFEVHEVSAGESVRIGGAEVLAVPADHDGRRDPWGTGDGALPLGYLIGAEGSRTYFAGDTDIFEQMSDLGEVDLALLPVWGWGHKLGSGHLDPRSAARAAALIEPRVAVPIHWGTYHPALLGWTMGDRLTEPPREFARAAAELAPRVRVEVLEPGDTLSLPDPR